MNKTFRILEILWLVIGCIGVLLCAYNIVAQDRGNSIFFLIFTFACGLMYAVRRRQRIKFEAAQKSKEEKK
ncbi:MAG: hypothetical protein K0S44_644 [Bacteroidetes bacterium]|jgi:hypothetical protein|nr:hypothetical protein [Bacteroidota bacterium]